MAWASEWNAGTIQPIEFCGLFNGAARLLLLHGCWLMDMGFIVNCQLARAVRFANSSPSSD